MNLPQDVTSILSAFSAASQGQRLMRLDYPRQDGPASIMLVNGLEAHEELSRDFCYMVEVLSDDASIPLKDVIGKMVTISLVRDDGTLRYFNGYVFEFRLTKSDGGFAFYEMVLKPWLAFLNLRKNSRVFKNMSLTEMMDAVFADYIQRDHRWRLAGDLPVIPLAIQHQESDHNHLYRRLEAAGCHTWYEHRFDGHTLCVGDDSTLANAIDGYPDMQFQSQAGSREDDGVSQWSPVRRIQPRKVTVNSYDFKAADSVRPSRLGANRQGSAPCIEVYEDTASFGFRSYDDGERLAQRLLETHDAQGLDFSAISNDRRAEPGRTFKLSEHFSAERLGPPSDVGQREYLILSLRHHIRNNYLSGKETESQYRNTFTCLRKLTPWRPPRGFNSADTRIHGVLTAMVVSPQGGEIQTEENARVLVRFHWDQDGDASQSSTLFVRVASLHAGSNFGLVMLPRAGQEVVVMFIDGNPDRPLIIGGVYNGAHLPPWTLPQQQALAGWRSRELGGQRGNDLIFDDTHGAIQTQLKSDHLHSQLSLGHIVRIDGTPGRTDARGEGFELRSDGHGVLRAAKGMLLTTEARAGAGGHIKDMSETCLRLNEAQLQHEMLAKVAAPFDTQARQTEIAAALKTQNDSVKGPSGPSDDFPELSAPHLVVASPAGIETSTAGSTHISSTQHTAITTGRSLSVAAGESLFATIRQAFRLFVHQAGMKLIAAAGDIEIQALKDSVNLLAKLNIKHEANRITITAKEELVINGGGTYARFSAGGMELGTNGSFVSHAAKHSLIGPKTMDVAIAMPPQPAMEGQGIVNLGSHPAASGWAGAGLPVKLYKDGALIEQTRFDDAGNLKFKHDIGGEANYKIELPNGQHYDIAADDLHEFHKISSSIGYHGQMNAGGTSGEDAQSLTDDRLLANPALRDQL